MICNKCGKDYSDKVYPIHIKMCKGQDIEEVVEAIEEAEELIDELDEEQLRAKAKELCIGNWHNKKIENLIKEISEVE